MTGSIDLYPLDRCIREHVESINGGTHEDVNKFLHQLAYVVGATLAVVCLGEHESVRKTVEAFELFMEKSAGEVSETLNSEKLRRNN